MAMTDTVKAAIYVRVSTAEQAQPEKTSLAQQREKAEAYCQAKGWGVVGVYEDAGVSGAKSDRPALTRLLADAHEGKFQRVVFLKLDRLGRTLRDLLNLSTTLEKLGVGIVSLHDSFDTATSSGRLFFSILGAVAEFERDLITERMQSGKLGAAQKGQYVGGPSPFGYDYDAGAKALAINKAEAAVVRRIFRWYVAEGLAQGKIAIRLNAEGVPTKTERVAKSSTDGVKRGWTRTHVRRILTNPQYMGQYHYNRRGKNGRKPAEEWVAVKVPRIVGEGEFKVAQAKAKRNAQVGRQDKRSRYLLTNLIRCRECGGAMMTTTQRVRRGKRKYQYRYYLCTGQHNYGKPCRPSERVNAEAIEGAVLGLLADTFSDPERVLEAISLDAQRKEDERGEEDAIEAMLARNLAAIPNEQDHIITLFSKEKITEAQFDKRAAALKRDEEKWREELRAIRERQQQDVVVQEVAASAHAIAERIKGIMDEMTLEERKALVRLLVERVWVNRRNEVDVDCVVPGLISDRAATGTDASGMVRL